MTRFGLQLPVFSLGVPDDEMFERVADFAVAGEESGFSSVWVMDHFYQLPPLGGADQPMLEAYTLLGALAARTTRVELGTLVTGVTYRNPAMLAKMVTTLDIISRGRAILGIGAAWYDVEHDELGFAFPPVGERFDRLEEALRICRAMFTEARPSFEGRHYRIHEARNLPRPVRPGGPPIMVGGSGEKRTLRLVAQYADLCNLFGDVDTIRHKLDVLRTHCADVGRDPAEITTTRLGSLFLTESPEQTDEVRNTLQGSGGPEFAAMATVGTEADVVEQVAAYLGAGLDELIFNLPMADAAGIRRAGDILTKHFG